MPIKQPDGNKIEENCCAHPVVSDGECKSCGYNWSEKENWVPF